MSHACLLNGGILVLSNDYEEHILHAHFGSILDIHMSK